jgi:hypothetical protein
VIDFDQTIEKHHKTLDEFMKGRPEFTLDMHQKTTMLMIVTQRDE